jgi:hypothetical protein
MQEFSVSFSFIVDPKLTITSLTPPKATQGQSYSFQFTATGGSTPYLWSATGLPDGLVLSPEGILSGVPTLSGSYSVVVTVKDNG